MKIDNNLFVKQLGMLNVEPHARDDEHARKEGRRAGGGRRKKDTWHLPTYLTVREASARLVQKAVEGKNLPRIEPEEKLTAAAAAV